MNIFVFGSSLTSTYWNGAATYYRGIYKSLHALGYSITFAEPDIYGRQQHRDLETVSYADVRVYRSPEDIPQLLDEASHAHIVVKHSGVGAEDARLERDVLACRSNRTKIVFWDVDAPATLSRLKDDPNDEFRILTPGYDAIFTYGGGPPIVAAYQELGARACIPIYNALDADSHFPVPSVPELKCDLAFVGHRLPDREARVEEFFFAAARLAPEMKFILGGEGWGDKHLPENVRWTGHVGSERHNAVNSSARMVLNVNRQSMADVGFSPPTRVFEAAGAGACVITDAWTGIEQFFAPGKEILCARGASDVVEQLRQHSTTQTREIGTAMRDRALRDHTYESRAREVDAAFQQLFAVTMEQAAGRPARQDRTTEIAA